MNRRDAESLRDQAAQPVLARIRGDAARVEPRLKRMLEYIASHLFDPQLQYTRMCSILGIRDHNRAILFRRKIGSTPAVYIRDCRFEVAAELLRRTNLHSGEIAALLGWSSIQTFTMSFRSWSGVAPGFFRKRSRGKGLPEGKRLLPREELPSGPGLWRRLASDSLTSEESTAILRHLVETYPEAREWLVGELSGDTTRTASTPGRKGEIALSRGELERVMARAAWEDLAELGPEAQVERVRGYTCFKTPAFVDYLGEKSLELGRLDAERGVHVARLALAAAIELEGAGDDGGMAPRTALAWMWLGNAKRIAGDVLGADSAFVAAERRLPGGGDSGSMNHGELLRLRAALRLDEARYEDALALSNAALAQLRGADVRVIAKALIVAGQAQCELRRFKEASASLDEAMSLLEGTGEDYIRWTAAYALSRCLFEQGELARAEAALASARSIAEAVPSLPDAWVHHWLEARIAVERGQLAQAGTLLENSVTKLRSCGHRGHLAVALVEQAVVCGREGRIEEAVRHAGEALAIIDAKDVLRESSIALQVLREAVASDFKLAELLRARTVLISGLLDRGQGQGY